MALVYIARNKINGKCYVGCTKKTVEQRIYGHVWHARKQKRRGRPSVFGYAILKYGINAFEFTILEDGLGYADALWRERHWIETLKPEYNVSRGGIGPNGVKWSAARRKHMARALRNAWTAERRAKLEQWWFEKRGGLPKKRYQRKNNGVRGIPPSKPILCLDDGLWFSGAKDGAAHYGLDRETIGDVCRGTGLSAGGRHFIYAAAPLSDSDRLSALEAAMKKRKSATDFARSTRRRPVICLTDGVAYPSGAEAARTYDLHPMTVKNCCRDGARTLTGLRFRYADEPARDKHKKTTAQREAIRQKVLKGLRKSWEQTKKRVICLDDGNVYDSISDAALAYGKHISLVSAAIHRGGRSGGHRFAFVTEKERDDGVSVASETGRGRRG